MDDFKLPRLYSTTPLAQGQAIALSPEQAHYFKTVLRRQDGDLVRLFDGKNGEWLCMLSALTKKTGAAVPQKQLRPQPPLAPPLPLFFSPIKKARLEWLIEKAVELGATSLHPVITRNTDRHGLNIEKQRLQIIEAAEQCERLDVPPLHEALPLEKTGAALPSGMTLLAALERCDAPALSSLPVRPGAYALLIGPEGGFTEDEKNFLKSQSYVKSVTLGTSILRSETAVCCGLSLLR